MTKSLIFTVKLSLILITLILGISVDAVSLRIQRVPGGGIKMGPFEYHHSLSIDGNVLGSIYENMMHGHRLLLFKVVKNPTDPLLMHLIPHSAHSDYGTMPIDTSISIRFTEGTENKLHYRIGNQIFTWVTNPYGTSHLHQVYVGNGDEEPFYSPIIATLKTEGVFTRLSNSVLSFYFDRQNYLPVHTAIAVIKLKHQQATDRVLNQLMAEDARVAPFSQDAAGGSDIPVGPNGTAVDENEKAPFENEETAQGLTNGSEGYASSDLRIVVDDEDGEEGENLSNPKKGRPDTETASFYSAEDESDSE